MSSVEQALVLGPYFVVNLFLAVLKTKFGKAQSLFQSKIVKHGKKRNILAAASGFLAAAMGQGRYAERRRLASVKREVGRCRLTLCNPR